MYIHIHIYVCKHLKKTDSWTHGHAEDRQTNGPTDRQMNRQTDNCEDRQTDGWLYTDGNGKLTFGEFCVAARYLGYSGSLKQLWKSLDTDNSGSISIRELDPEADTVCYMCVNWLLHVFVYGNK